jgi:5-methylthioadenosine/S-adenosylhomocysteine deaminase
MNIHIKGAEILYTDGVCRVEKGDLFLSGGKIAGINAAPEGFVADKTLGGADKLVMPGLINSHTHAYMTIFRNYADDLLFDDWLFGKILPVEDRLEAADAYWCDQLANLEMIRSGTTCFLDMHIFKNQCARSVTDSGMRAVLSRGLVGEDAAAGQSRLAEALEDVEFAAGNDRLTFLLAPHAIYTCGEAFLRHLVEVATEKNMGFHIHVSETQGEFDNCMTQHGMTPVAYLNSLGLFDRPTVAAHCVYLTDEDIALLAEKGVSVATNPVSNMKLANGFAPVPKLLHGGVNVAVGTDGTASNNRLNMFAELATLSYIHKGVEKSAVSVSAAQALRCGTVNGAKALGLEGQIGEIKVGMKADLILLDLQQPQFYPRVNLVAGLVYSANGSEVDTVIVDGNILMENRQLLTLDEERIYSEITRIGQKLLH